MKRYVPYLIVALVTLAGSLVLTGLLGLIGFDWTVQSDVGQSFSGASALLAAFALLAITRSNEMLRKQNRTIQGQAAREMQFKLLQLSLDDVELQETYSTSSKADSLTHKQRVFLTMRFRYLQHSFISGELSERSLRAVLMLETFPAPVARKYWEMVSPIWMQNADSEEERRFVAIATEIENRLGETEVD